MFVDRLWDSDRCRTRRCSKSDRSRGGSLLLASLTHPRGGPIDGEHPEPNFAGGGHIGCGGHQAGQRLAALDELSVRERSRRRVRNAAQVLLTLQPLPEGAAFRSTVNN